MEGLESSVRELGFYHSSDGDTGDSGQDGGMSQVWSSLGLALEILGFPGGTWEFQGSLKGDE